MTSRRHWRKGVRYDVSFKVRRKPEQLVRSVPAANLTRLRRKQRLVAWLLLLSVLGMIALLTHLG